MEKKSALALSGAMPDMYASDGAVHVFRNSIYHHVSKLIAVLNEAFLYFFANVPFKERQA